MRTRALAVLTFFLLCLFTSCQKKDDDLLFYQKNAFACELEVVLEEITLSARVSGGEWSAERGNKRDIMIEFTAPETMEGIILTREGGVISVTVEGMPFEDNGYYSSLAAFADLLELSAVPTSFSVEGENTRAELSDESGGSITLLLDKKGLPIEIVGENITVRVISFSLKKTTPAKCDGSYFFQSLTAMSSFA